MVVISNGFKNFHLVMAAAEANSRHILTMYIAGAYPTELMVRLLSLPILKNIFNVPRFIARSESINNDVIRSLWLPELLQLVSLKLSSINGFGRFSDCLKAISFRWYSYQAVKHVKEAYALGARVYHYRAGFGHKSAEVAKKLGMITLCDHSIVHPEVLDYMINHNGALPASDSYIPLNCFWKNIQKDFSYADELIVNSTFVKNTFISRGWNADLINVHYLGIDSPFIKYAKPVDNNQVNNESLKLMFAGNFGQRKGADTLIKALEQLKDVDWKLEIAGTISPYVKMKYPSFLTDSRVTLLGSIERSELAEKMTDADIFVFPSLAEGSARVIFEAMACACYIIATPNTGAIVKHEVHGSIVSPGNIEELTTAISTTNIDRVAMHKIGCNNAELIKKEYLQSFYGQELSELYVKLQKKYKI